MPGFKTISLILITGLLLCSVANYGQFSPDPPAQDPDPQAGPPPPNDAPIDGGVSLLLAAGAAYGVKKYREHKKKGGEGESESK